MKVRILFGIALAIALLPYGYALSQPEILWSRDVPWIGSVISIVETPSGGYAVLQTRRLTLFDANGDSLWSVALSNNNQFSAKNLTCLDEGAFAITGRGQEAKCWILKIDYSGEILWSRLFGDRDQPTGWCVQQGDDGTLYIAGGRTIHDIGEINFLLNIDQANGDSIWLRSIDEVPYSRTLAATRAADGCFVFTGVNNGIWIAKVDWNGRPVWQSHWSLPHGMLNPRANSICPTADGGFAVSGYADTYDGRGTQYLWLKVGARGGEITSREFGMHVSDRCMGLAELPTREMLCGGSTDDAYQLSDLWLIGINTAGDSIWSIIIGDSLQSDDCLGCIGTRDGGVLISELVTNNYQPEIPSYLRLLHLGCQVSAPDEVSIPHSAFLAPPFPNPFNSSTTISYDLARPGFVRLGVYDAGGRLVGTVKEGYAGTGKYLVVWNGGGVGNGVYYLNLEVNGFTLVKPIVLLK